MPRKPPKGKSLAEVNPVLAKQWHPIKNGELTPFDVSCASNTKVWWKCNNGDDHEWQTSVAHRSRGTKCPICAGQMVVKSNCLATTHPKLSKEWHPNKNGLLTAYDVVSGSNKKVWWKCPKGDDHEWQASIKSRKERGCSICAGKTIVKSNCLATTHPEVSKMWHPTKNTSISAHDVTAFSLKKVWWKCPKGDDHEWKATVANITNGNGCSICYGRTVVKSNCLATTHPKLSKEWHPSKNGLLTPHNIVAGSNKRVWWKCSKGDDHEWKASVNERKSGQGCSICAGKTIVKSNCLTTTHPYLANEWHPTKNGNLTPNDIISGSHKKVWWKCSQDSKHEWSATVGSRATGNGCPSCAESGFDILKEAYFYVRKIITNNKIALKFGITNQMDGGREKKQKRHLIGEMSTIFKIKIKGTIALEIENSCKEIFGKSGFLSKNEFPDGYTETIKYSEDSLDKIKSIVKQVLKKN